MLVNNPKFEISAVRPNQYPSNGLPEIVLVGKSNVGKSSFVNTMINRKKLARTSSEPGKTRQINFYNIDDTFYFVDLPGYGYSKMSKNITFNDTTKANMAAALAYDKAVDKIIGEYSNKSIKTFNDNTKARVYVGQIINEIIEKE